MNDYYTEHESSVDPFNWTRVHTFINSEIIKNYIFDHAVKEKTSLLMPVALDGIEIDKVQKK